MVNLNPKVLLHSKWTAVTPINKDKHFRVTQMLPDKGCPSRKLAFVEMEAVYSGRKTRLRWRELSDTDTWQQGWC
ncbi:hypothetical protein PHACT_10695 [Pseudohongiella acticola]|jgi:tryptophan-rich hypothetical protein|uniref:TIGR02450 family Trp-rich protein n=1 Tax=Pseudohongiella acticola TaxID=1524254 RepID=A0A1E8CM95_9GAMM|nr:TIGR02450 family Trp-rich protein [Pseudohongiella acticola]OFE13544.1 hypothetical protein PHACT_10695 [Pseudohongiella acticola]